ncbi:MAG: hypothetical protein U0936_02390 [Planctomycetaceae bacterium]
MAFPVLNMLSYWFMAARYFLLRRELRMASELRRLYSVMDGQVIRC